MDGAVETAAEAFEVADYAAVLAVDLVENNVLLKQVVDEKIKKV